MNTSQSITGRNATNNSTFNHLTSLSKTNNQLLVKRINHNQNHTLYSLKQDNQTVKSNNKVTSLLEQNTIWTNREFVKYFKAGHILPLLFLKLLILVSIAISIMFSIFRLLLSYNYISNMHYIRENFSYFTGRYTLVLSLFNNIRVSMLNDINNFHLIEDFNQYMNEILVNQELFPDNKVYFPMTGELHYQTTLKINDPQFDINTICDKDEKCRETIHMENNFCSEGIELGIYTMLQKYYQIIRDFQSRPDTPITLMEIVTYFRQNNLAALERTIDFVFVPVQRKIYDLFRIDSTLLAIKLQANVIIISAVTMAITLLITVSLIFTLYLHINSKYKRLSKEASKINHALFNT